MLTAVIVFFVTLVATALSSMSGGGASAINIPVFLWLGMSFPVASATQKVSSVFWVLPVAYNFLKGRKVDWVFLSLFSLIGLIGIYIGILVIISTSQRILEFAAGILILCLVAYTYFKKDIGMEEQPTHSRFRQSLAYVFALFFGFYEGIFGAGNGIMVTITTFYTKGFDFIDALGYYFAAAFPWVIFAAALLISKGYYDVSVMVPAVFGSVIGGYFGSKFARYKGNRFIKLMYVIFGGILGLKLVLGI